MNGDVTSDLAKSRASELASRFSWIALWTGCLTMILAGLWVYLAPLGSDERKLGYFFLGVGYILIGLGSVTNRRFRKFVPPFLQVLFPAVELSSYGKDRDDVSLEKITKTLERKLESLELQPILLEPQERSQLISGISHSIATSLAGEIANDLKRQLGISRLMETIDTTKRRLADAIQKTATRTTNNLVYGIVFSIIAVVILFMSLGANELKTTPELLRYFVPRISVVLLVELVAYFFLKLYRSGIDEIRFYQNELTNFEARSAALEASLQHGDKTVVKAVIAQLMATERNFILAKGATTVELERVKMQQDHWAELVKALSGIAKTK